MPIYFFCLDVMVPVAKISQLVRYKLFGVVYHHGMSAWGRYTLDVLHPNQYPSSSLLGLASPSGTSSIKLSTTMSCEGWVRIDDNVVVDVCPEDVFGGDGVERDETRCAYLLFYKRV